MTAAPRDGRDMNVWLAPRPASARNSPELVTTTRIGISQGQESPLALVFTTEGLPQREPACPRGIGGHAVNQAFGPPRGWGGRYERLVATGTCSILAAVSRVTTTLRSVLELAQRVSARCR